VLNVYFVLVMMFSACVKPLAPKLAKRIAFRTMDRVLPYPLTDEMLNEWAAVATPEDRKRIDNIRHGNRPESRTQSDNGTQPGRCVVFAGRVGNCKILLAPTRPFPVLSMTRPTTQ
jgi:hypothetical protein